MTTPRMLRRDVLRLAAGVVAGSLLPGWLHAGDPATPPTGSIDLRRTLVLIELRGGNDGLNTVVPHADALYRAARPTLAIPTSQVAAVAAGVGLHPALAPLAEVFAAGDLAIIQGLGYPHPNRSHFRGIDIWHGATKFDELSGDGWLARILARAPTRHDADLLADGIVFGAHATIGHQGLGPLFGPDLRVLVMDSPQDFITRAAGVMPAAAGIEPGSPLAHVLTVQSNIAATAQRLAAIEAKAPTFTTTFPDHELGRQLGMTAKLIAAEADVPVWKLTLDGFDTHANQLPRHADLMRQLATALAAFRSALIEAKLWDRVMVATYSEFGRRVEENASAGTDHGTASPHFVLGGKVQGGLHGRMPDLAKLDYGDLIHTTDFRSLYLSIARDWWGFQAPFLSDQKLKPLPKLIRT